MAFSLNEQMESDLGITLEGAWGLPVELTGPDGIEYKTSANSPDPQNPLPLKGQVLRTTVRVNPETGESVAVNKPSIALRITSLERVPQPGEHWYIKFPTDPSLTAELQDYMLSPGRAPELENSIGFIRLYPTKVVQS